MNKYFRFNLDASVLFEKSTLRELAEYLAGVSTKPTASKEEAALPTPITSIFNDDVIKSLNQRSKHYGVRFTKNQKDLRDIFKLRYFPFGKAGGTQFHMQYDELDAQFQNVIFYEKNTESVIGVVRFQDSTVAKQGKGFYNDHLFYLSDMPAEVLNNALEFSRLCIHQNHRSGEVAFLVFEAYKFFMSQLKKRYLFGSVCIFTKTY